MQRLGRKGHPTYRVVVQDSRQTPTSGKYVAMLGSYDPHTKANTLVKEKAQFYLDHGAQPSDRVVKLFASEGIKLPKWVNEPTKQERTTRNPEKLRKNQPAEEAEAEQPTETVETEAPVETQADDIKADEPEKNSEETTEEVPATDEVTDTNAETKSEDEIASEAEPTEAKSEGGKPA